MNQKALSLIEIVVSMVILSLLALSVSATMSFVTGTQSKRGATGTLEAQATNYARQTIEELKNAVSTETATGQHGEKLVDSDATTVGGTSYTSTLPSGALKDSYKGTRQYTVWDVDSNNDGVTDYKKVEVTVQWQE